MINKISLPPIRPESLNFKWADVKRTVVRAPQIVRHRANVGIHTVDDDYDYYQAQLTELERRLVCLEKTTLKYSESIQALLTSSVAIGQQFKQVFSSDLGRVSEAHPRSPIPDELYQLFASADRYIDGVSHMEPKLAQELEAWVGQVQLSIQKCLALIKPIKKYTQARNNFLVDLDRYTNYHESVKKKKELSTKQHQSMISNERKMEVSQSKYENVNNMLKKELPIFFELVKQFIAPIFTVTYFLQLTIVYQINTNLHSIKDDFNIDMEELLGDESYANLVMYHEFKYAGANDIIKNLSIVNFHETFLNDLAGISPRSPFCGMPVKAESPASLEEYCVAVYSFRAIEPSDISLKVGDVIKILDRSGEWWTGELQGQRGSFPGNYVKLM
ncbi:hypothetical protein BABINDRAFT_167265 [Babjeviella inositovora NRRL Y-12698]|uniref:SH3 domain-containing protein n=1 Tax=Babjeviella inositovora NRRL Y-12698 TaxID=984486 RepID=A0A1E3QP28_9ASCO|nr:uncharacterized protein BABINDRAFT_167265 [Babjeviella inositovora NRRL Y-12698]ODQ79400.1 hypothetical protein BABINDRAFT_167265 [Babjeviella inositovora NRRL Y-12698]